MTKNKMNRSVPIEKSLKKLHRIMKLTFLFLLLGVSSLFAKESYSQSVNFNLNMHNATLEEVFDAIRNQSEFEFFYNNNQVNTSKKVNLKVKNATLEEILSQVLNDQYNYKIEDRYVLISKKNQAIEPAVAQQQGITIKGHVSDENNEPLIGVSVTLIGHQSIGTTTNVNGDYSIVVPDTKAVLRFSYLGYTTEERAVQNQKTLNIQMKEATGDLDEVVVVGYGVQKKLNLTGSVGVATGEEIQSRPITSVSNGLQGLLSGVTVTSYTGQPGASNGTIRIRGIGTIGNSNPLILIDGVEGNINLLNPEDIQSVSVLKDAASSSIYGARAANGVVLVTTKNVQGAEAKPQINFNGYYGFQMPTSLPEMLGAADYIKMDMEATSNVGKPSNYTQAHLNKVLDGSDPDYFNNSDWVGSSFKDYAPQQNYTVSVTGRGSNMGYMLSYGYLDQEGLTVGNSAKSIRNNFRAKLSTKVASIIDITGNIGYTARKYSTPSGGFGNEGGPLYTAISISPVIPIKFTDGRWGYGGGSANPIALLYDSGTNEFKSQEVNALFTGKITLMKGWDASATYSFKESNSLRNILSKTINYYRPGTNDIWYSTNPTNKLENRDYYEKLQTIIAQTNFERKFGQHTISALAGFSQEWFDASNFTAERTSLLTEMDPTLDLGSKDTQTNSGGGSSWALRSGFGRLNYNFNDRYLLEANLRYDLSSRFAKENRGGLFPSISGAWRISEEEFLKTRFEFLDNLKLRLSYGQLGNQYVGSNNYPYLAVIGGIGVPRIGTTANDGYTQTSLPNPNLTWETIEMYDIGLDISLFKSRLNIVTDFYVKNTKDILLTLTYPNVLGLNPTEQNAGVVRNTGWEVDIRWNDHIGKDFRYGAKFNLSDVKNKIVDFGGLADQYTESGHGIRRVGYSIDAYYGYIANGFATPEDFERYNPATNRYEGPKFPVLVDDKSKVQPGDIKLKDIDGDGKITSDLDRDIIGSSIPRYTYNFTGDLGWKGFDLSFTLQGVADCDGVITGRGRHAFTTQSDYPQKAHLDHWSFENPNPNAKYPRLTFDENYNQRFSTFWMEDASYLRLKNVNFGYTFSPSWTKKLNIDKLRLYCSADNLLTFTDFYYAFDPETPRTSGGYYPQTKTVVFGFNLTFK